MRVGGLGRSVPVRGIDQEAPAVGCHVVRHRRDHIAKVAGQSRWNIPVPPRRSWGRPVRRIRSQCLRSSAVRPLGREFRPSPCPPLAPSDAAASFSSSPLCMALSTEACLAACKACWKLDGGQTEVAEVNDVVRLGSQRSAEGAASAEGGEAASAQAQSSKGQEENRLECSLSRVLLIGFFTHLAVRN